MPEIVKPPPSPLELQLMNQRAERALVGALRELDGAADEPLLAMMTATLIVVHALQAVAALESETRALRMLAAFQGDTSVKVLNTLRAARELLGPPAGQA
jgi:hypothetical protein